MASEKSAYTAHSLGKSLIDEDVFAGTDIARYMSFSQRMKQFKKQSEAVIFNSVYAMCQENKFRTRYAFAGIFIDFIQVFAFTMSTDYGWGPEYDSIMSYLVGPIQRIGWDVFVGVWWTCVITILSALAASVYVGYSFIKSDFRQIWPIKFMRTIVNLLVTVLFIPVTAVLLSSVKTDSAGNLARFSGEAIAAFQGDALFYGITSILMLVIFVPFCLLMGLLNFELNPKSSDIMARSSSRLDFVYIASKAALVIINDFGSQFIALRIIYLLVLMVFLVSYILITGPYYKPWVNILRAGLFGALLGASIDVALAVWGWGAKRSVDVALLLHFGLSVLVGVAIGACMFWRIRTLEKRMTNNSSLWIQKVIGARTDSRNSGRSTPKVSSSPIALTQIRGRPSRTASVDIAETRSNTASGSTMTAGMKMLQNQHIDQGPSLGFFAWIRVSIYHFVLACVAQLSVVSLQRGKTKEKVDLADTIFQQYVDRYPRAILVRVLYCSFIINYREDWVACAIQLQRALALKPGFDLRWTVFVLQRQVEREKKSRHMGSEKDVGLMSYVEFQHNMAKARKFHFEALKRMRKFWEVLLGGETQLLKLGIAHAALSDVERKAIQAYSRLIHSFPGSPLLWRSYGSFMNDVRNEPEQAQAAFQFADEIEERASRRRTTMNVGRRQGTRTGVVSSLPAKLAKIEEEGEYQDDEVDAAAEEPSPRKPEPNLESLVMRPLTDLAHRTTDEDTAPSEDDTNSTHSHSEKHSQSDKSTDKVGTASSTASFWKKIVDQQSDKSEVRKLAVRFSLALVLLGGFLVAQFITGQVLVNQQSVSVDAVVNSTLLRINAAEAVVRVERIVIAFKFNHTEPSNEWKLLPHGQAEEMDGYDEILGKLNGYAASLRSSASQISADLSEYWEKHLVDIVEFDWDGNKFPQRIPILNAIDMFERKSERLLHELESGYFHDNDIFYDPEVRFVVDNGLEEWKEFVEAIVNKYLVTFDSLVTNLLTIVISVAVSSVILVLAVGVFIFRPALDRIHNDKHFTLAMFLLVPMKEVAKTESNLRKIEMKAYQDIGGGDEDEAMMEREFEDSRRDGEDMKFHKEKTWLGGDVVKQENRIVDLSHSNTASCNEMRFVQRKYIIALVLVAAIIGGHTIQVITGLMNDTTLVRRVSHAHNRQNLFFSSVALALQLPFNFHTEYDAKAQLKHEMDETWHVHYGLLYGDEGLGITPNQPTDPAAIAARAQTIEEMDHALDAIDDLIVENRSDITLGAKAYETIMHYYDQPGSLTKLLSTDAESYHKELTQSHNEILTYNTMWLIIEILSLVFLFLFVLKPITRELNEDRDSIFRILRMVSPSTIRKTSTLRNYMMDQQGCYERMHEQFNMSKKAKDKLGSIGTQWSVKFLDKFTNAVVLLNRKGKLVYVNANFAKLVGYNAHELLGSRFELIMPQLFQNRFNSRLKEIHRSLKADKNRMPLSLIHKDGSMVSVGANFYGISAQGALSSQNVIVVEMKANEADKTTAAKKVDGKKSNAILPHISSAMFEFVPGLIISLQGKILHANAKANRLFGMKEKQMADKQFETVMAGIEQGKSVSTEKRALKQKIVLKYKQMLEQSVGTKSVISEFMTFESEGVRKELRVTIENTGKDKGNRLLLCYFEDVSEVSTAENAARQTDEFLTALLNSSTDAIIRTDENGVITLFSKQAESLFTSTAARMLRKKVNILFQDFDPLSIEENKWTECVGKRSDANLVPVRIRVVKTKREHSFSCIVFVVPLETVESESKVSEIAFGE